MACGKMERPCWTIFLVIVWILLIPGTLLTHISVGKLIPVISDLPDNIIKGFDEVFRFKYLEQDAKKLETTCEAVVKQCPVVGFTDAGVCANDAYKQELQKAVNFNLKTKDVNTADSKATILKIFQDSLAVVKRVANDKYLGTEDLQKTANELNTITDELVKIDRDPMECVVAIPIYCTIYNSADEITKGMSEVNKAIDEFKTADAIQRFEDNKGYLTMLHALPYFMVLAMLCFTFFWFRGGVCCCCRGGTKSSFFALLPMTIFWLVSFILYAVVLIVGWIMRNHKQDITVDVLKGKPTLEDAIDHLQTAYPEFWNVVFADMVDPLELLFASSLFFTLVAIVIVAYGICECICMPYRKPDEAEANS